MNTIRSIIIDDEHKAIQLLEILLRENCGEVEIVATCSDLPSAVKAIHKYKPALVFSDIEMPGHSGLELLDFFNEGEKDFSIIFTTAYQQYSIHALKMQAFDYILKPIDVNELKQAIDRFKKKKEQQEESGLKPNLNRIAVPTGNSIKFIDPDKIMYLKADNTYTEVYLVTGEKLIISRTLKNFEDTLESNKIFFRSNKSYIVNYNFIDEYVKSDGGYLLLKNKIHIPISPDKVQQFMELIALVRRQSL